MKTSRHEGAVGCARLRGSGFRKSPARGSSSASVVLIWGILFGCAAATARPLDAARQAQSSPVEGTQTGSPQTPTGSYSLLYSFECSPDGASPEAGLVRDSAGNLYGTTESGGQFGFGTVFKVTASGTETVLHSFAGAPSDGAYPYFALLTMDSAGNLYGSTATGGESGNGVVFKLSPSGVETVLYSFVGGTGGGSPRGGLVRDNAGNFYGATFSGGAFDDGLLFKLSPSGTETVLQSFNYTDGANPDGGLIRDLSGNLYGTTAYGGSFGNGVVFELTTAGTETVLHSFADYPTDGAGPYGVTLLRDAAGDLYGVTYFGGVDGDGTVFKLDAAGTETILLNFNGGLGGGNPYDGLAIDATGNLYGTTEKGGSAECGTQGCGVLFKLTQAGKETVLHNFDISSTDGGYSYGGIVRDPAGNLYGTLSSGGASGCGAIFKFTP